MTKQDPLAIGRLVSWRAIIGWPVCAMFLSVFAYACAGSARHTPTATLEPRPSPTAAPCDAGKAITATRRSTVRIGTPNAVGTGVIVGDGLILTTEEVVRGAAEVQVTTANDTVAGAVVVHGLVDFALVRADTEGLPAIHWGNPALLTPGQRLIALGYALDLPGEASTTTGSYSALRTIAAVRYVQTDTPINAGSSGGPLFTECSDVVGIDAEPSAGGIGFAIDATVAKAISDDMTTQYRSRNSTATVAPNVRLDTATPQPPASACGTGAIVGVNGVSPVGRSYRAGDTLQFSIKYHAPGCKSSVVRFTGYYPADSPVYQYWCIAPAPPQPTIAACRDQRFVNAEANSEQMALTGADGVADFSLPASAINPKPGSIDPIEGFTICNVHVELNEARFPGHIFEQTFGGDC